MIDLNELCNITLKNAEKRNANGGDISTKTRKMLQHCATEVVEAMEAWTKYQDDGVNHDDYVYPYKFSDELADIICCVLIIAGKEQIDIEQAINGCIEKNRKRAEKIGDKL